MKKSVLLSALGMCLMLLLTSCMFSVTQSNETEVTTEIGKYDKAAELTPHEVMELMDSYTKLNTHMKKHLGVGKDREELKKATKTFENMLLSNFTWAFKNELEKQLYNGVTPPFIKEEDVILRNPEYQGEFGLDTLYYLAAKEQPIQDENGVWLYTVGGTDEDGNYREQTMGVRYSQGLHYIQSVSPVSDVVMDATAYLESFRGAIVEKMKQHEEVLNTILWMELPTDPKDFFTQKSDVSDATVRYERVTDARFPTYDSLIAYFEEVYGPLWSVNDLLYWNIHIYKGYIQANDALYMAVDLENNLDISVLYDTIGDFSIKDNGIYASMKYRLGEDEFMAVNTFYIQADNRILLKTGDMNYNRFPNGLSLTPDETKTVHAIVSNFMEEYSLLLEVLSKTIPYDETAEPLYLDVNRPSAAFYPVRFEQFATFKDIKGFMEKLVSPRRRIPTETFLDTFVFSDYTDFDGVLYIHPEQRAKLWGFSPLQSEAYSVVIKGESTIGVMLLAEDTEAYENPKAHTYLFLLSKENGNWILEECFKMM